MSLTLYDKLELFPAALAVGFTLVYITVSRPFRKHGGKTLGREMSTAITMILANRLNIRQLQYFGGSSTVVWKKWIATQSVEHFTELISEGAKLHWIGKKKASKILLHVHGGGYIMPLSRGHLKLASYLRDSVAAKGVDMSIPAISTALAPSAPYPIQLRQINAALRELIDSGIRPSDIIISGDSAGGHIALCTISHFLHPHPMVDSPPALSSPFAGLLLISPRTTNKFTAPSFDENANKDTLSRETLKLWMPAFRANSHIADDEGLDKDGFYTEPRHAPLQWWDGLARKVVKKVFISAGEHECYRDDTVAFSENWKKCAGVDMVCVVEESGRHDSPVMDFIAGRPPTDLILDIVNWLSDVTNE